MTIRGYAVHSAKGELKPFEYSPAELGAWEVEIAITHCGICHSDVHLIDNDWGISRYPLVPGHEIVGTVAKRGSAVRHLKEGERVGVGWQASSCLVCPSCSRGEENLCPESQAVCLGHYGGFAERVRADSRFTFPIPPGLSSENAAPLFCGGATVYSPIREWVKPPMRVGVIGVGGLGHLALQYAKAFGCEVTAFSSAADKEREAREFGAHHFVVHKEPGALERLENSFDFLLSTVNAPLEWPLFLGALRSKGTLCFVGVAPGEAAFPVFPLIVEERRIVGSVIGSRDRIREMLEFSERHKIRAKTEPMGFSEVNQAVERVRKSRARYRVVLAR